MAKKQEERVRFVGEFDPQDILKGIARIQNQLNNSSASPDITKAYTSQLKGLEKKVNNIMSRINKGFGSNAEIDAFEREVTSVFTQFFSLSEKFKGQKIDFSDIVLTEETSKRFNKLKKDIDDYINKLKSLSGERATKIQRTGLLSAEEQGKLNTALNIKDEAGKKNALTVQKGQFQQRESEYIDSLEKEKIKLNELNAEYDELIKKKEKYSEIDIDSKDDLRKELENIRDKAEQYAAENHTTKPINKDLNLGQRFEGSEIKYKDETGKEVSINVEQYKQKLELLQKIDNASKELEKTEKAIATKENGISDLKEKIATHEKEIDRLKKIKTLIDILTGDSDQLSDEEKKVLQEIANWTEEVKETTQNLKQAEKEIEDIEENAKKAVTNGFNKMAEDSEKLGGKAKGASGDTDKLRGSLEDLEKGNTFFKQLKSRIGMVMDLGSAFNYMERMTRYTFNAIKELDAAFTEISVVTNKTNAQLWESFGSYNDMAQELGVTTNDAIKTSALYYQQGLDTAEVMSLTEETIKMARIAGMDFAEATDRMTAAIRGFKLEMEDASIVNDVFSALAAESAVDTNELSYALTKTASIAKSAGMELETTSAFLSQMIETTREAPENIGTAMKTIIARFQELKKNVGEVEIEGELVDANKIEGALRDVGIALRDEVTGQFRDLDDVFLELASKWDTLDRNTQRYVATIAAGSRQQSRFLAMMDNYERTVELVDIASNSAGASSVQFDKTLDSVDSKINKIKASGEELIGNLISNKSVKGVLDIANNILQTFTKISEAGPAAVIAFSVVAYRVIKNISSQFMSNLKMASDWYQKFTGDINKDSKHLALKIIVKYISGATGEEINSIAQGLRSETVTVNANTGQIEQKDPSAKQTPGTKTKWYDTKTAKNIANIAGNVGSILSLTHTMASTSEGMVGGVVGQAAGGLVGTIANFFAPGVGTIIGAAATPLLGYLGTLIGNWVDSTQGVLSEKYKKSIDNLQAIVNEESGEFNERNSGFFELYEEYEKLNSRTDLTVEETKRLEEVNQELCKSYPELTGYVNEENGLLVASADLLAERNKKLKEEAALLNALSSGAKIGKEEIEAEKKYSNATKDKKPSLSVALKTAEESGFTSPDFGNYLWAAKDVIGEESYKIYSNEIDRLNNLLNRNKIEGTEYMTEMAKLSEQLTEELAGVTLKNDQGIAYNDLITLQTEVYQNGYGINGRKSYINQKAEELAIKYGDLDPNDREKINKDRFGLNDEAIGLAIGEANVEGYENLIQAAVDSNNEIADMASNVLRDSKGKLLDNIDDESSKDFKIYKQNLEEMQEKSKELAEILANEIENSSEDQKNKLKIAQSFVGFLDSDSIKKVLGEAGFSKAFQEGIGNTVSNIDYGALAPEAQTIIQNLFDNGDYEGASYLAQAISEFTSSDKGVADMANGLELLSNKFGENSNAVKEFKKYALEAMKDYGFSVDQVGGKLSSLKKKVEDLTALEKASIEGTLTSEDRNNLINKYGFTEADFQMTADGYKLIGDSIQDAIDKLQELNYYNALVSQNAQQEVLNKKVDLPSIGVGEDYAKLWLSLGKELDSTKVTYAELAKYYKEGKINLEDYSEEFRRLVLEAVDASNGLAAVSNQVEILQKQVKNNDFTNLVESIKELDSLSSEFSVAQSAIDEFNNGGQLSLDTALNLIDANEEYATALDVVNGVLTINESKIREITNAKLEAYREEIKIDNQRILSEINALNIAIDNEESKQKLLEASTKNEAEAAKAVRNLKGKDATAQAKIASQLEADLNSIAAKSETEQLNTLTDRAIEEAKILDQMSENWKAYYRSRSGENAQINTQFDTVKEISSGYVNSQDYEAYYNQLLKENDYDSEKAINALIKDSEGIQSELEKQVASLKKQFDFNNKSLELANYAYVSSGGKSSASSQKEYNLELDKFYNILKKIAQTQRDINKLERERENLTNYKDLADNDAKRISASKKLEGHYKELLSAQKQEQANIASQLSKYSNYVTVLDGYLQVNHSAIDTITNQELGDELKKLIDEYDNLSESINDTNNNLAEQEEYQKEAIENSREYSQTLKEKLLEQVIEIHEKEIQAVKDKYGAIKEEDNKYLESLRKNLQKQRDLRNTENEEEELVKLERRLALLKRDTSGIYANDILELEEEIADKRQSIADTETDKMIEELSKQYEAEHESMDRETEYLDNKHQENLESMTLYWQEVENILTSGYDSILSYLQKNDEEFITGSKEDQEIWLEEWKKNINEALAYKENITNNKDVVDNKTDTTVKTNTSSATDGNPVSVTPTPAKPVNTTPAATAAPAKTQPDNGESVTLESGKKIYTSYSGGSGVNPYYGTGPYTVLWQKGSRVQVRYSKQKSGVTGWLNISDLVGYSKGGLVTETGPVMVHGSASKPEAFLSANDTKLIGGLRDALAATIKKSSNNHKEVINEKGGDNYYEIHIHVDELDSDYSVDEMMAAMEKKIVNDARSRNVIAIKRSR